MTSERIIEVALEYFADLGYAGTSFSLIATAVGIKKQSIYAHFRSKEHLYFECFERVITIEYKRAQRYRQQLQTATPNHEAIVRDYVQSNQAQQAVQFLYRASLSTPKQYKQQNKKYLDAYRLIVMSVFETVLEQFSATSDSQQKIDQWLCFYDGCLIESILNGNAAFQQRFEHIWPLFWEGIVLN